VEKDRIVIVNLERFFGANLRSALVLLTCCLVVRLCAVFRVRSHVKCWEPSWPRGSSHTNPFIEEHLSSGGEWTICLQKKVQWGKKQGSLSPEASSQLPRKLQVIVLLRGQPKAPSSVARLVVSRTVARALVHVRVLHVHKSTSVLAEFFVQYGETRTTSCQSHFGQCQYHPDRVRLLIE
jgi:hypothetical protein